jgi:hypothetical protein
VLEQIIVNYAPQGFTAYESANELRPGLGRTGMPVAIEMTLRFKETQIMTKDNYRFNTKNPSTTREYSSPEDFDGQYVETPEETDRILSNNLPLDQQP